MSNTNDLLGRALQIAQEEGLFDKDGPDRMLPDPRETELNLAKARRVLDRVAREDHRGKEIRELESPRPIVHVSVEQAQHEQPVIETPDTHTAELAVREQLDFLSTWCETNQSYANKDRVRYWVLKAPALLASVSVSAIEAFGYGQAVIVLGVVAAFCVGVDAAFPGGQLHNVHRKAANEIRRLQHDTITRWRQAQLEAAGDLARAASAILKDVQTERTRIDEYVTQAEASLGRGMEGSSGRH